MYACEEIYIVSQKDRNGDFNKLCKSQERWWYSAKEAQTWLDSQPDYLRVSNAVFKLIINLDSAIKVADLAKDDPKLYAELSYKVLNHE